MLEWEFWSFTQLNSKVKLLVLDALAYDHLATASPMTHQALDICILEYERLRVLECSSGISGVSHSLTHK